MIMYNIKIHGKGYGRGNRDFPVLTKLLSYLSYGLFITDLSMRSIKTNN